MEKKWDYIDDVIKEAFKEIEPDIEYNGKLTDRIHRNSYHEGKVRITAASFILAGVLAMFLYASNAEFKIMDYKYKVESQILVLQYSYHMNINRFFLGEWTK